MGTNIVPISALPETLDPLNGDEDLPIVQGGVTKRIKTFRALAFTLPEWRSDVIYAENAVITYNGNLWRSLTGSNVGNIPSSASEYWIQTAVTPSIDIQGDNLNHADGRFVRLNGQTFYQDWATYGHRLTIIDPVSMTIVSSAIYGTFSGTASLITAINAVPGNYVVTLVSCGQITIDGALRTALAARGGRSTGTPGSGAISHVFIGQAGLQPGEGYEVYDTTASLRQQCYVSETGIVKQGKEGPIGNPVIVQGSVDASSWHTGLLTGDVYMRTSEDNGATWSDAVRILGEDGESGKFTNFKFAKNTSQSTPPSYTANADNPGSNWFDGPQTLSGGEFQWFIKSNWRDTVRLDNWTAPVRLSGETGATGAAGTNNAMVLLYKRSSSAPTRPSTSSTFTFATGVLAGHDNGWTQAIPAVNGQPCWVIAASASSNTATDTILPAEWSSQVKMVEDGTDGTNGLNSATVKLYKVAGSSPAVPTTTSTYTFSTGVLTGHDNGWTQAEPAEGTDSRWVISAVAVSSGATDDILTSEWSTPVRYLGPPSIYPSDTALSFRLPLSDMPELPDNAAGAAYRSSFGSGVDGFTVSGATWALRDGNLVLTLTSSDPNITRSYSFNGGANRFVIVKVRQLAGTPESTSVKLYWYTGGHGPSESYQIPSPYSFSYFGNGNWSYLVFDMTTATGASDWSSNTITGIRFDIPNGGSAGQVFEVGWIYIGDGSYAPKFPLYSQATWATVDGWLAENQCTVTASGGKLQVVSSGTDPYFLKSFGNEIAGKVVRFRLSGAFLFEFCYVNYTDLTGIGCTTLSNNNGLISVLVPVNSAKTISSFRIDAANAAGTFYVDYIDISDGIYGPLQDTSPSALKLSCQPGVVRVPGPSGYAVDTTYGGLYSASEAGLPMGNSARTLPIWFKTSNPGSGVRMMLNYGKNATDKALFLYHSSGAFVIDRFGSTLSTSSSGFLDNLWHLLEIVFTYTGPSSGYLDFYIDGTLRSGGGAFSFLTEADVGWTIGYDEGTPGRNFQGQLKPVPMWSRAHSAAEVLGLYAQTPAPDAKSTEVAVTQKAPKYLGSASTAPSNPNPSDWYLATDYPAANQCNTRTWSGSAWTDDTSSPDFSAHRQDAGTDIINFCAGNTSRTPPSGWTFIENLAVLNLFVTNLMAQTLKVGYSLRGGDRYAANGTLADGSKSGFFLGATGSCKVAGITFEGSQGGGVQWGSGQQVGTGLVISGASGASFITSLNGTTIAFYDIVNKELRTYRRNGNTWIQVGSGLLVASGSYVASLAAINSTDVAFVAITDAKLRTYRWNGSTWSLLGSELTISMNTNGHGITALDSTHIAYVDYGGNTLRTYEWNGSTWSAIGTGLVISGGGYPSITTLSSTRVAIIHGSSYTLRTYEWNGSTWSAIGTGLVISGASSASLAALNGTDVAMIDSNTGRLIVNRWDGSTWATLGSSGSVQFTAGASHVITALNGSEIALKSSSGSELRTYAFNFAIASPYLRQITG